MPHYTFKELPEQSSTLGTPLATVARKNFPLTGRNLEQARFSVDDHLLRRGGSRDGETVGQMRGGDREKKWGLEKLGDCERDTEETGEIEEKRIVSRSSGIQAGPWRGFWIQHQYQSSGG